MQMSDRQFDWIFVGLPPICAVIAWAVNYSLMSGVMGGRPLTPLQKTLNLYLFLAVLGIGYVMGATKLLSLSPSSLWLTLPALVIFLAAIGWWRHKRIGHA
jgi:hypothetical protein